MKLANLLPCLAIAVLLSSCVMNKLDTQKSVITLNRPDGSTTVTLSVTKGEAWSHELNMGPFSINVHPQVVFWLEDANGNFIETLYITNATGDYKKHATKKEMQEKYFAACFPVWAEKLAAAGGTLPTQNEPYTDAVTSATPQSSFDVKLTVNELPETFRVCAELNKSADYNETYTEDNAEKFGQPSVVYAVDIKGLNASESYLLTPIGHGNSSSAPVLTADLSSLDTALKMVDEIQVTFATL